VQDRHFVLSVLFFKDHAGEWNAQALEHDIAASGSDIDAAKRAFEKTVSGHVLLCRKYHREPLSGLKPAPRMFWLAWAKVATEKMSTEKMLSLPAFMIPAVTYEQIQAR
jgi:hypothetical protein